MRVTIEKSALVEAVSPACRVATSVVGVDVSLGDLEVSGWGSSVTLRKVAPARIEGEHVAIEVSGRSLDRAAKACSAGAVTVDADEGGLTVTDSDGAKFIIPSSSTPGRHIAMDDGSPSVHIDGTTLRDALNRVRRSASKDATLKPLLCGVHLKSSDTGLVVTATDSYRVAVASVDGYGDNVDPVTIPNEAIDELVKMSGDEIAVSTTDTLAKFVCGDTIVACELIAGDYPDVMRAAPKEIAHTLTVDSDAVAKALRKVSSLAMEVRPVDLYLSEGEQTHITSNEVDVGMVELTTDAIDYRGAGMTVSFNPTLLAEVLEDLGGTVQMELNGPVSPVLATTDAGDHKAIIMTVRRT